MPQVISLSILLVFVDSRFGRSTLRTMKLEPTL